MPLDNRQVRSGSSLVELLVVIAVIGLLLALLLPAVQAVRESARQTTCRSQLRQVGLALLHHEAALQQLPAGLRSSPDGAAAYGNAFVSLLSYLEQGPLADQYDSSKRWDEQSPAVAQTPIPILVCPSGTQDNPQHWPVLSRLQLLSGTVYGRTDYVLSKGTDDVWCAPFDGRVRPGAGVFDINRATRLQAIRDGLSNTLAVGEGAGGQRWVVCRGTGCQEPFTGPLGQVPANGGWLIGSVGNQLLKDYGFLIGGIWATTVEAPNKWPVTDSWAEGSAANDCRRSLDGGPHSAANFRSDHPGGVNFLAADGSVSFLSESTDLLTYRRRSTIQDLSE